MQIFFKYERNNPGGSIKDRSALHIINEAEKRGLIKPGATIIEPSSGNFGISLAMISAAKGCHTIILVDPKATDENLVLLKSFGAELIVVSEQGDSGSYHKIRIKLANKPAREIPNSFRPDQCFNLMCNHTFGNFLSDAGRKSLKWMHSLLNCHGKIVRILTRNFWRRDSGFYSRFRPPWGL